MLLNILMNRAICFEINSGAGPSAAATAAASAAAEAAAAGGGTGQATQPTPQGQGAGEKPAESSDVKLSESLQKELDRRTKALKNLQAENARLKEGKTEKPAETTPKTETPPATTTRTESHSDDPMKHPAVKGLALGEEDGTVIYKGAEVPAEFVIGLHEERADLLGQIEGLKGMQTQIDEIKGLLDGDQTARSQAQLEQAQSALFDAAQTAVVEMREQAFPNLPKEHHARVDKTILRDTDEYLDAALKDGKELSAELITECGRKALDDAKVLFGIFGAKQADGNSRYASNHPVKPDGQPGTHKPAEPKTRGERTREQEQRTKAAEAWAEAHSA